MYQHNLQKCQTLYFLSPCLQTIMGDSEKSLFKNSVSREVSSKGHTNLKIAVIIWKRCLSKQKSHCSAITQLIFSFYLLFLPCHKPSFWILCILPQIMFGFITYYLAYYLIVVNAFPPKKINKFLKFIK